MGFWVKLTQGLALMAQVLAIAATLDSADGTAETPEVRLQIQERTFRVKAVVRRVW